MILRSEESASSGSWCNLSFSQNRCVKEGLDNDCGDSFLARDSSPASFFTSICSRSIVPALIIRLTKRLILVCFQLAGAFAEFHTAPLHRRHTFYLHSHLKFFRSSKGNISHATTFNSSIDQTRYEVVTSTRTSHAPASIARISCLT